MRCLPRTPLFLTWWRTCSIVPEACNGEADAVGPGRGYASTYTPTASGLRWLIAFLVFVQLPLGLYMSYRGNEMITVNEKGETVKGIFDALTGVLYSSHKLIGLTIFLLIVLRLLYRVTQGAPAPDPCGSDRRQSSRPLDALPAAARGVPSPDI